MNNNYCCHSSCTFINICLSLHCIQQPQIFNLAENPTRFKLLRSTHFGYSKASTQAGSSTLLCATRWFLNVRFVNSNTRVKGLHLLFANVVIDNSVKPFSVLGHDGICPPFHSCRFVDNWPSYTFTRTSEICQIWGWKVVHSWWSRCSGNTPA